MVPAMNKILILNAFLVMLTVSGCADKPEIGGDAPLSENAIVSLADRMRSQGDITLAADFYQRALQRSPDNVAAYLGLAALHEQVGQPEQAGRYYLEAVKRDGDNAAVRRAYGRMLLVQGNHAAAAEQYQAALKSDSDDVKALNGLGVAYDQMGKHGKAQEQYRRVLKNDPEHLIALGNLGLSLIAAGDVAGAIEKMAPAADSLKMTSNLRQNLALAYVVSGREAAAQKLLRRDLGAAGAERVMTQLRQQHDKRAYRKPAVADEEGAGKTATVQQLDLEPLPSAAIIETPSYTLTAAPPPLAEPETLQKIEKAGKKPFVREAKARSPKAKTYAADSKSTTKNKAASQKAKKAKAAPAKTAKPPSSPPQGIDAVVGPFATDTIANTQSMMIREKFSSYLPGKPFMNIVTELTKNGTPRFVIRISGFEEHNAAADFCDHIAKRNYRCATR